MSRIPLIQLPAPRAERPNDPLEEKTFKEEVLFNSSFVKMVRDDIKLPDGGLSKRLYLTHGGACAMVALGDDGTILLERQWRHPLKRSFWELPAGKIDPNEEEIACAKRELIEECGVQAQEWTKLGVINNAIGYSNEHIAIYLAIEMCEMTTTAVGAEFGNRNHSTVSTSYKKVQKMIQEDRTVTEDLKSLRDKITLRS